MIEICRNVEPFMQPQPTRNPGGDCFACTFTAMLRYFYPEDAPTFDEVFGYFMRERDEGGSYLVNIWMGYPDAIHRASRDDRHDYRLQVENDFVYPAFKPSTFSHSHWIQFPVEEWSRRIEAWLSTGWLAIIEMQLHGGGPVDENGKFRVTDHVALLDGYRCQWVEHETVKCAKSLLHEVHVVCSAKGAYWISVGDLLKEHGVAGLWIVRKDVR